jgi:hypothetical protein
MTDHNLTDLKALAEKATAGKLLVLSASGAIGYVWRIENEDGNNIAAFNSDFDAHVFVQGRTALPLLIERVERAERERDAWMETARQHHGNEQFYHGLVTQIGETFGVEAKTSDDGSIQQDVLALKVPELVANLQSRLAAVEKETIAMWASVHDYDDRLIAVIWPTKEQAETSSLSASWPSAIEKVLVRRSPSVPGAQEP